MRGENQSIRTKNFMEQIREPKAHWSKVSALGIFVYELRSALRLAKPSQGAVTPYSSVQELSWEVISFFLRYPWK